MVEIHLTSEGEPTLSMIELTTKGFFNMCWPMPVLNIIPVWFIIARLFNAHQHDEKTKASGFNEAGLSELVDTYRLSVDL